MITVTIDAPQPNSRQSITTHAPTGRTHAAGAIFARAVVLAIVSTAVGLGACGGATEPVSHGPTLAAYYTVDGVDGKSLPTPAVLTVSGDSLALVRAALTLDPLYTKWEMDLESATSSFGVMVMRPRAPVVIGLDSVEVYLSASAQPVLAGRFTDTSLVLRPPGGVARPAAPIDSLGAHAWRLRPSGSSGLQARQSSFSRSRYADSDGRLHAR